MSDWPSFFGGIALCGIYYAEGNSIIVCLWLLLLLFCIAWQKMIEWAQEKEDQELDRLRTQALWRKFQEKERKAKVDNRVNEDYMI